MTCLSLAGTLSATKREEQRPNILWIVSEDNSPLLGCYGDSFATTPNLDRMASQGVLYENAFANVPVCAPARFTIITGMYASAMGTLHMRSRYRIPSHVRPFPEYLRKAGYYCTNRSKTDYNFATEDNSHWDESSAQASYRKRKPGQPFFSVINIGVSHESSLHETQTVLRHDPERVPLPPYHPDTPEIRHDWAQYYDQVEDMDVQVQKILDDLNEDGLDEETIVFYYSDHGGILCRSKRFVYDSGTHVPMIIRFPKKFQQMASGPSGSRTDRVVSFVDFAPTVLSLAGVKIPDYMQGAAFLGEQSESPQEYAHLFRGRMDERYDMMRGVRDKQYKYIRNYMPHRIYGQHLAYLWRAPATRSWEKACREGRCNKVQRIFWQTKPPEELYDVTVDPWEVNDLAMDPKYKEILERMRRATMKWVREVRDPGFIPEGELIERTQQTTAFDLVRQRDFPIDRIIEMAENASLGSVSSLPEMLKGLEDPESAVRFWAATGCVILGEKAGSAEVVLTKLLTDASSDVRIVAAEALAVLGKTEMALPILVTELENRNTMIALHAANVLDVLGEPVLSVMPVLDDLLKASDDKYIKRALTHTINKFK